MFGFPGSSGFGQPAQQPAPAFGAQPPSPFGASFGQPVQPAASPFGAATGSAPLFGAQAAAKPAGFGGFGSTTTAAPFGAQAQTYGAFGAPAQSAPAFGTGLGSAPSFGATLTPAPAFGAASTPAFGATQSAPAFGSFGAASAPAFGAPAAAPPNPFGAATTGFGAMAAPSFGAAPASTGFGAPAAGAAAPFGTTTTNVFGNASAAPSPFGVSTQPGGVYGGFGAAPSSVVNNGTRNVPFSKTKDPDASAGQPQTYLMSMSAMLTYQHPNLAKSHEELRWEDYQDGVKNQNAAPSTAAAGGFGAPAAAPTPFGGFGGTTQPAATGFGTTVPANPFAAPASAPAFGATTAPAFGAAAASQPSLFGTVTAPAAASNPFSAPTTASAFGNFGAASSAASQPSIFGSTTTGFGTSAPFGSATPFGGASSAAAFSFNSTPAMFAAASAPATSLFGTAPASSPFGGATNTLGAVGSPFGAASSASAFGANTFGTFGAVGTKPASPFAPATTTPFGTAAPSAAGTSPFGNTFNFNTQPASSPSLFGNTATGTGLSFASNIFGTQSTAPAAGGTLFGAAGASQPAPVPPPSVAQPAYGNFGALPTVPEPRAGITARAGRNSSISSGSSKASPLLSLRTTPLRFGASVRTRTETPGLSLGLGPSTASRLPASGTSDLLTLQVATGAGSNGTAMTAAAAFGGTFTLPLRQNPHRLFIAAPPPSIEAAGVSYLSPARLPSAQHASTPDRAGGAAAGDDDGNADATATQTPAPTRIATGVNGYAFGSAGATANGSPSALMAAAGQVGGPAFQDSPASEPHLPRLGRLVSEGFSFTPNVDELRLLHSQNPDNLAAVSNFTVLRAGVGQVRWVVPVDVRGLALYDIVSITYGEVLCYPDASVKPHQGQGLNKPAEITLYGVYKKDKETSAPIKEGPRGQAYEKLLRQMCGRMGAKFLSYKLDGGVWKFEVEHFSRYGLMDIDEDDDVQWQAGNPAGGPQVVASVEEGVGEAPLPRLLDLDGDVDVATAPVGQHGLTGRGLAGLGLRGFAFGAFGGPAASAADGNPLLPAGEDSGMEPSVGARWQQRRQLGTALVEAGGSEATGAVGPGGVDPWDGRGGRPPGFDETSKVAAGGDACGRTNGSRWKESS